MLCKFYVMLQQGRTFLHNKLLTYLLTYLYVCLQTFQVWKCRVAGYEEATKKFKFATNEKDPEFNVYLPLMKKFVIDSNAVAQEKGLEAVRE